MKKYQICTRCVMDTTDPDIEFDENEICNHCKNHYEVAKKKVMHVSDSNIELDKIINKIKEDGKGKKYECIMGLSGGVDSSYVAYLANKYELRPLAVHLDNGWNSEIGDKNINNIVSILGLDFYKYQVDWEEFKDLQRSFFKSSVVDIEVLTDNAISSFIFNLALKENLKYHLCGVNIATETIMPKSWSYTKTDVRNIMAIQKKFGTRKIKNIKFLSTFQANWNYFISKRRVIKIDILNYIDYNKSKAKDIVKKELSWKDYGAKHFESIFTRFYQAYILPKKFKIDKRRAHLSDLICSGQISREEAIDELKRDPYPSKKLLEEDKEYVLNKLGFSNEEFEAIMREKPKSHLDYPNEKAIMRYIITVGRLIKPFIKC